jgi:hypothetical protein
MDEERRYRPPACIGLTIHFVHYNFVRINKALRVTPAMGRA